MAIVSKDMIVNALNELEVKYYELAAAYKADEPISVIERLAKGISSSKEEIADMARTLHEECTIYSDSKKLSVTCYGEHDVDSARLLMRILEDSETSTAFLARAGSLVDVRIGEFHRNPIEGINLEDYLKPDTKFKVRVDTPRSKMTRIEESINWALAGIGMEKLDNSVELMDAMDAMASYIYRGIEELRTLKKEVL